MTTPLRVDVPFSEQEKQTCKTFLKNTGRKVGPWVRVLILQGMSAQLAGEGTTTQSPNMVTEVYAKSGEKEQA